jgi:hypothetical protein
VKFPFVLRWQLELSEQRREQDRVSADILFKNLQSDRDRHERAAEQARQDLRAAEERFAQQLDKLQDRYHEVVMNPPTGILKGPTLIDPLDDFGELSRAAIKNSIAGKSPMIRDAVIKKAQRLKIEGGVALTDEALAQRVMRGEYGG